VARGVRVAGTAPALHTRFDSVVGTRTPAPPDPMNSAVKKKQDAMDDDQT